MPDFKVNPQPWMRDAVKVADEKLVKQIADDFRAYNPAPRSTLSPPATVQVVGAGRVVGGDDAPVASGGTGWASSPELKPPPGVSIIDEMCAQEDQAWRLQRAKELAAAHHARALVEAEIKQRSEEEANKKQKEPK
jgi:hypothetical protein